MRRARLEAWSEVDKDLAELNGNVGSFRLSEAKAFLEAMNQEFAQTRMLASGDSGSRASHDRPARTST